MKNAQQIAPLMNAAVAHHQAGRFDEARPIYERILQSHPRSEDALHLLGWLHHQQGRSEQALGLIRRAITINPGVPDYHSNCAEVCRQLGDLERAVDCYRNAIRLNPRHAQLHSLLGEALMRLKRNEESLVSYENALRLHPDYPPALTGLGSVLANLDRWAESLPVRQRAVALDPHNYVTHNNLGLSLYRVGRTDDARAMYEQALRLKPDSPEVHWNLSQVLLLLGDWQRGWAEYEWRWVHPEFTKRRPLNVPTWNGEGDISNQTILLHTEQGLGDTIHFIRYAPMVAQRAKHVIVEIQPELESLLAPFLPGMTVIPRGRPVPRFDTEITLTSLPFAFQTTPANVPLAQGYLRADEADREKWKSKLATDAAKLKIGFAWGGSPSHKNDKNRSMPFAAFAPLLQTPGVSWYSLQKGDRVNEIAKSPKAKNVIDLTNELKTFSDTAALISALDLVISVDTSIVHLAGALGKPVWTLLPFVPDFRWMLERDDTPWYSSMKLFRQARAKDWETVIASVSAALHHNKRNAFD